MENKNKKDMSVDDLVNQLKLVLDIEDDEIAAPQKPQDETVPAELDEPKDASAAVKTESGAPSSISEKVRLLDEYFAAEEEGREKKKKHKNKRDKKKNRADDRREAELPSAETRVSVPEPEKEPEKPAESEPKAAVSEPAPSLTEKERSEKELNDFANEIGALFSDPDDADTKTADAPEPEPETNPEPETKSEPEPEPEPGKTVDAAKPEPEDAPNDDDARDVNVISDDLQLHVSDALEDESYEKTVVLPPQGVTVIEDSDGDGEYDDPFVDDKTVALPEDEGGKTRRFDVPDAAAPDAQLSSIEEDIEKFSGIYSDMHPDNDGYSTSDEAIMDAFAEAPEPPEKNPVKVYKELSVSDIDEEQLQQEEEELREKAQGIDEFVSYDQRKTFLDGFRKNYSRTKLSLILSSVFAVLVFVYECLTFGADKFPFFCSPANNPSVFILIDLQLFSLCAIFAVKYVISGLKGVFSGKATASSVGALAVIFTYIYGIIAAVTAKPVLHPVMSASALVVVLMLSAELRCIKRDTLNFRIISGTPGKSKFVMESYVPRKNSAEEQEFYDYVPEDPTMLRISKTNFVRGFVESNMKSTSTKNYVNLLFPVLALIFAGVLATVLIVKKDIGSAINAAYIASSLCMPAAFFSAITLPSFACAKKTYNDDSCVISEAAAEEYADASVVTFEDSDVFPPSLDKITSVRVFNESRMDHIMYVLTSLFRKVGGPLLTICENAAREYKEFSNNVTVENAVEGGIEATVDSQKVYLGSAGYMGGKLDPKYTLDDRQYENNDKSRIMYMIINDVVCAKFYIEYEMDRDFLSVIKQLSTSTRCVAIRTLDPNIDTKLIKDRLDTEIYHCRLIRSRENERRRDVSKSTKGAIVSRNSVKALLRTLMLCDKTVYSSKINMVICFLSVIIGLLFSVILIFTGTYDSISALHALGYQLLLCLVIRIVTKINI